MSFRVLIRWMSTPTDKAVKASNPRFNNRKQLSKVSYKIDEVVCTNEGIQLLKEELENEAGKETNDE